MIRATLEDMLVAGEESGALPWLSLYFNGSLAAGYELPRRPGGL